VNQGEYKPCCRRRILRCLDHSGFGIESSAASDKGRETNGEHSGSAADVEQGFIATQTDLLRNPLEKLWRVRFPVAGIEFNSRREGTHGF
jgi:acetolactate synthase regulatory subunit